MARLCEFCGKVFKVQFTLNRHYRNQHKIAPKAYGVNVHNMKCLESNCNSSFNERKRLTEHLEQVHRFAIESEDVLFKSVEEFDAWKSNIELEGKCNYIKQQGKKISSDNASTIERSYYVCNRSLRLGKGKATSRKRATKSKGSCKLPYACISTMTVVEKEGDVHVRWIKSHYGHELELQHLRINKQDCVQVAEKLALGASKRKILDANRGNIGAERRRIDLLTYQDIVNIQRKYSINIQDETKHKNDATSVDMWIKECYNTNSEDNPILLYKQQGEAADGFNDHDFCLVIMNKYQVHMLLMFGTNIICVDSTHGLINYDCELSTMLVVDSYGEEFPVAVMFTNKKDESVYEKFFDCVKSRVGVINCKTFMSDITPVFYNAWCNVMSEAEHQLHCAWHIDRAFRVNLNKIGNSEKRAMVYKTLKFLQQSLEFENETNFQFDVKSAEEMMLADEETHDFGLYFQNHFGSNYRKWAYFFRRSYGINTNMFLESMHQIIKYYYLDGRTVNCLDIVLHAVLNYTRDKMVERLVKNTKGKSSKLVSDSKKQHRAALTSSFSIQTPDGDIEWLVKNETSIYKVTRKLENNCCTIKCSECNICLHMYACTCVDYYIRSCICKHIHYVVLKSLGFDSEVASVIEVESNNEDFDSEVAEVESNFEDFDSEVAEVESNNEDFDSEVESNFEDFDSEIPSVIKVESNNEDFDSEVTEVESNYEDNQPCLNVLKQNPSTSTDTGNASRNKARIASGVAHLQDAVNNISNFEAFDSCVVNQVCSLINNASDLLRGKHETTNFTDSRQSKGPLQKIDQQLHFCSTKKEPYTQQLFAKPKPKNTSGIKSVLLGNVCISTSSLHDHAYL